MFSSVSNSILLYTVKPVGAASVTAVIVLNNNIDFARWEYLQKKCCEFLRTNNIKSSKIAILGQKEDGIYPFKFIQIRDVGFETGYDCGNSMIAAGYVAAAIISEKTSLELINIDTKLKVLLNVNGNNIKFSLIDITENRANIFKGTKRTSVDLQNRKIDVALIDTCNPYILVNAESLAVNTAEQLMNFNNHVKDEVLPILKNIRNRIIEKFELNADSEFPKIAIVYNREIIAARTIYLDKWHEGLPITAAISILKSVIMNNFGINTDYIATTKERRRFAFEYDLKNEKIMKCEFDNIIIEEPCTIHKL
jgi:hypothetical protein